jgi:hypothetical protein
LNGRFAIRQPTFAPPNLNGRFGSTPAHRGCDTIDRYCDAGEGQSSADCVEKLMWDYFEVDVTQQCFGETGRRGRLLHRSQQLDSKVTDKNGQRSFSTE